MNDSVISLIELWMMDLRQLRMLCNWFDIWILIGQNKYVNTDGSYNDWADTYLLTFFLAWSHYFYDVTHEILAVYVKIEKFQNYSRV